MFNDIMGTVFIVMFIIGVVFLMWAGIILFGLVFLIKGVIDLVKENKGRVDKTKYKGGKIFVLIGSASIIVGIVLTKLTLMLLSNQVFFDAFTGFINRII